MQYWGLCKCTNMKVTGYINNIKKKSWWSGYWWDSHSSHSNVVLTVWKLSIRLEYCTAPPITDRWLRTKMAAGWPRSHLADDKMLVVLLVHGQQRGEELGNLLLQLIAGHEVAHGAHGLRHRQPELEHTADRQRTSVRQPTTTDNTGDIDIYWLDTTS